LHNRGVLSLKEEEGLQHFIRFVLRQEYLITDYFEINGERGVERKVEVSEAKVPAPLNFLAPPPCASPAHPTPYSCRKIFARNHK